MLIGESSHPRTCRKWFQSDLQSPWHLRSSQLIAHNSFKVRINPCDFRAKLNSSLGPAWNETHEISCVVTSGCILPLLAWQRPMTTGFAIDFTICPSSLMRLPIFGKLLTVRSWLRVGFCIGASFPKPARPFGFKMLLLYHLDTLPDNTSNERARAAAVTRLNATFG